MFNDSYRIEQIQHMWLNGNLDVITSWWLKKKIDDIFSVTHEKLPEMYF